MTQVLRGMWQVKKEVLTEKIIDQEVIETIQNMTEETEAPVGKAIDIEVGNKTVTEATLEIEVGKEVEIATEIEVERGIEAEKGIERIGIGKEGIETMMIDIVNTERGSLEVGQEVEVEVGTGEAGVEIGEVEAETEIDKLEAEIDEVEAGTVEAEVGAKKENTKGAKDDIAGAGVEKSTGAEREVGAKVTQEAEATVGIEILNQRKSQMKTKSQKNQLLKNLRKNLQKRKSLLHPLLQL